MLGDLRKKLTTVGRLDLMRAVDDKATGYFATLDPRDLSDRALEEQARSLTGIGQVRLDEGNHDAAMTAFREAHARSTALHQRAAGQRPAPVRPGPGRVLDRLRRAGSRAATTKRASGSASTGTARSSWRRWIRNNFDWQKRSRLRPPQPRGARRSARPLRGSRARDARRAGAVPDLVAATPA